MRVIIIGSGKFARDISKGLSKNNISHTFSLNHYKKFSDTVIVHAGSGNDFMKAFNFAEENGIPLIELSTGTGINYPDMQNSFMLRLPNLSPSVWNLYETIEKFLLVNSEKVSNIVIFESHQSSKQDVSGTAIELKQIIIGAQSKTPYNYNVYIESIRDPQKQFELGVPTEYINSHAYHWVRIKFKSMIITNAINYSVKLHGRNEYAESLLNVINKILLYKGTIEGNLDWRFVKKILYPAK